MLIYFTKNNKIIPFDLIFKGYIANLFVSQIKDNDFSIIYSLFDNPNKWRFSKLFDTNLKILEIIVEVILSIYPFMKTEKMINYDNFLIALFHNLLEFFKSSWLFNAENRKNEMERIDEEIEERINEIKTKFAGLKTKIDKDEKTIHAEYAFFIVIPSENMYDLRYLNEWSRKKPKYHDTFSILDYLIFKKAQEAPPNFSIENYYEKKVELAKIIKNSLKQNFEVLDKFSKGENSDKKKRIFNLFDLENSLEKINYGEKVTILKEKTKKKNQ